MSGNVPIFNTGIAPELLTDGLRSVFEQKVDKFTSLIPTLFQEDTAQHYVEEDLIMDVLPYGQSKEETASIAYVAPRPLLKVTTPMTSFALGIQISREMIRYNRYKDAFNTSEMLGDSMIKRREVDAMNIFNNAFTAGSYPDASGALISATHNSPYGNQSNILSTPSDLTEGSLEDAITLAENLYDTQGKPAFISAKQLVVAQSGRFNASRIMNTEKQTGTNNNDINAIKYTDAVSNGYVSSRFLTDQDAWFLTTDANRGLLWYNGIPLEFNEFNDGDTLNKKYSAYMNYGFTCPNWQALVGSQGS